jgi:hypothetical protein
MGFSMLSLPAVVEEATAAERREMEDFAIWALNRTLRGIFPLAAYEDMGFDCSDIEEIRQLRRQRAAGEMKPHSASSSGAISMPGWFATCGRSGC